MAATSVRRIRRGERAYVYIPLEAWRPIYRQSGYRFATDVLRDRVRLAIMPLDFDCDLIESDAAGVQLRAVPPPTTARIPRPGPRAKKGKR